MKKWMILVLFWVGIVVGFLYLQKDCETYNFKDCPIYCRKYSFTKIGNLDMAGNSCLKWLKKY